MQACASALLDLVNAFLDPPSTDAARAEAAEAEHAAASAELQQLLSGEHTPAEVNVAATRAAAAAAAIEQGSSAEGMEAAAVKRSLEALALAFFDIIDRNEDGFVDAAEVVGAVIACVAPDRAMALVGCSPRPRHTLRLLFGAHTSRARSLSDRTRTAKFLVQLISGMLAQLSSLPRSLTEANLVHGGGVLWPQATPGVVDANEELTNALLSVPLLVEELVKSLKPASNGATSSVGELDGNANDGAAAEADGRMSQVMERIFDFLAVSPSAQSVDHRRVRAFEDTMDDALAASEDEKEQRAIAAFCTMLGALVARNGDTIAREEFCTELLEEISKEDASTCTGVLTAIFDDDEAVVGLREVFDRKLLKLQR